MNLSKEQEPKLETMSCEPHWPSMFDLAISKTISNVPVNEGKAPRKLTSFLRQHTKLGEQKIRKICSV